MMTAAMKCGWSLKEYGVDNPLGWWKAMAWTIIEDNFRYDPTDDRYLDLLEPLTKIYDVPLVSRTRVVFRTGDGHVIKVPITNEGEMANINEFNYSQNENSYIPVTPTEQYRDSFIPDDLFVIIAQEVTPAHISSTSANYIDDGEACDFPDWVRGVDCQQVGYLPDGRLVAYDL